VIKQIIAGRFQFNIYAPRVDGTNNPRNHIESFTYLLGAMVTGSKLRTDLSPSPISPSPKAKASVLAVTGRAGQESMHACGVHDPHSSPVFCSEDGSCDCEMGVEPSALTTAA
jgi:hypothetical protein